uniref:Uncharacterized protein n=1 Tax=Arundo donax TaxID=35708 RepID=A0A0A9D082_ARUDO
MLHTLIIPLQELVASIDASREKEQPVSGRSSPISLHSSTNSPACFTTRSASASGSSSGSSRRRLALSILALARGSEYCAMSTRALSSSCVPSVKKGYWICSSSSSPAAAAAAWSSSCARRRRSTCPSASSRTMSARRRSRRSISRSPKSVMGSPRRRRRARTAESLVGTAMA